MNKSEFIAELKRRLSSLPQSDIEKYTDYYSEMIDDRIEDGLSEYEAVNDLGSIDSIISQILADAPGKQPAAVSSASAEPEKKKLSAGWIILIAVLTSPIWLPAISSALSAAFAIIIAVFSVIIALYAVDFALFVCGIVSLGASAVEIYRFNILSAAICFGLCLMLIGFSVLLFFGANWLAKQVIRFIRFIFRKINELFTKRGAKA